LNPPLHRPLFLVPDFFPSLEKSFQLPVYVEPLVVAFVAQHIVDPVPQTKYLDPRVHELMDVEACEFDRSISHSMTTSSSTTDSEDEST
jgi:predicted Co/Zn/Cd cation transporter (cation efflux family)